jgi:CheY-like chemotaxis protein
VSARKLLLADDSITVQKVVNLTFAEEGIDVVSVSDGDAALERIATESPDVALLDVNMPGANGYQVCEAMRANAATRHIPVILLVGSFEPFDESEAARVGANAYLTKPFHSIRQLVSQVTDLIKDLPPRMEPGTNIQETFQPAEEAEFPTQTQPETFAVPAEPNGHEIDDLYTRSIVGEESADHETSEAEFADQGLDDENIEANVVDMNAFPTEGYNFEPVGEVESVYETEQASEPDNSFEGEGRQQASPTFEVIRPHTEPGQDWSSTAETQYADVRTAESESFSTDETVAEYEPWKSDDAPESQDPESTFGYQEPLEDPITVSGDGETPLTYGDEVRTEEFSTSSAGLTSPFDSPADSVGDNTVRFENYTPPEVPGDQKSEEVELLELPPVGDQTIELTTADRADLMDSNRQIVSISPELMDIIVQRVVEKLSEKY